LGVNCWNIRRVCGSERKEVENCNSRGDVGVAKVLVFGTCMGKLVKGHPSGRSVLATPHQKSRICHREEEKNSIYKKDVQEH